MNSFLDITNKCQKPTIGALKEALKERDNLSNSESNFITYMAGFSHYEFAESLFDEFGLKFINNKSIIFDSLYKKFHLKVLVNDLIDLPCFSFDTIEIPDVNKPPIFINRSFSNCIAWRNQDGSYVKNIYQELKTLNILQIQQYYEDHILGLQENI